MESEKVLHRIQLIAGSIFFGGILLKSFKVPFMGPLLVVIGGTLSLLLMGMMLFSLITKWKTSKGIALLLFFINLISCTLLMAILFGVMFWPNSQNMILSSLSLYCYFVLIPGIIYYFVKGSKRKDFWQLLSFDLLKSIILIAFASFIFALPKEKKIDIFSSDPAKTRENFRKEEIENQKFLEDLEKERINKEAK